MKKEGRQHGNGIVKATTKIFPTPKSNSRPIINPPPRSTSSKPINNRSKLVGKCGKARCVGVGCHFCKPKDKAYYKGTYKLRSCDVGLNHRLISWRVVDNKGLHQLKYAGISATQVLDQLKNHYYDDVDDDDEDFDDDRDEEDDQIGVYGEGEGVSYGGSDDEMGDLVKEDGIVHGEEDEDDDEEEDDGEGEVLKDEIGDFCDVGYFVIEQLDGDEDWCLVGEL